MHLGLPSFFGMTTIFTHHSTGSPIGTGSIIPFLIDVCINAFFLFHSSNGVVLGLVVACGVAPGLR